jgi:hypothetical protein
VASGVRARRLILAGTLAAAAGCSGRDERPPLAVIDAILDRCHGDLRGRLTDVTLELRAAGDDRPTTCLLGDGGKLRVDDPEHGGGLVRDGKALGWRAAGPARELEGDARERLERLHGLLEALLLIPLYAPLEPVRTGARTLRLGPEDARTWTLEYEPASSLPTSLRGPAGEVRFVAFVDGPRALPREVELSGLGRRQVRLLGTETRFAPDVFAPPGGRTERLTELQLSPIDRPRRPVFARIEACTWLVVADPGTWTARRQALERLGGWLWERGQSNAGDPFLMKEGGDAHLVIPFEADPTRAQPPPTECPEGTLRPSPAHIAAVVQAPDGGWDERVASAVAMLGDHLATHGVTSAGEPRLVMNLFFVDNPDEHPGVLRTAELRVELPVER